MTMEWKVKGLECRLSSNALQQHKKHVEYSSVFSSAPFLITNDTSIYRLSVFCFSASTLISLTNNPFLRLTRSM
jgi:hypothetical protein